MIRDAFLPSQTKHISSRLKRTARSLLTNWMDYLYFYVIRRMQIKNEVFRKTIREIYFPAPSGLIPGITYFWLNTKIESMVVDLLVQSNSHPGKFVSTKIGGIVPKTLSEIISGREDIVPYIVHNLPYGDPKFIICRVLSVIITTMFTYPLLVTVTDCINKGIILPHFWNIVNLVNFSKFVDLFNFWKNWNFWDFLDVQYAGFLPHVVFVAITTFIYGCTDYFQFKSYAAAVDKNFPSLDIYSVILGVYLPLSSIFPYIFDVMSTRMQLGHSWRNALKYNLYSLFRGGLVFTIKCLCLA